MALVAYGVLLFVVVATTGRAKPLEPEADDIKIEMRMPEVQPTKDDTYLCYAGTKGKDALYLTGFIPHANMSTAHHLLLYGCTEPGQDKQVWDCGEMQGTGGGFVKGPVCRSGAQIIYAWAMDAPDLKLPQGVAFKVFGDTDIHQLVMQIHYKSVDLFVPPKNGTDHSGLTLVATTTPQPRQAGVYLLGTGGSIAPHSVVYMETACSVNAPLTIHPFAYRAHAHTHGEVVSGYRVRDGQWTEIGRVSPKLPEMFYNVTNPDIDVENGDILAARCTMVNEGDEQIDIGQTASDEMCNFYIMYYVDGEQLMRDRYCFTPGPPNWNWNKFPGLNPDGAPANASLVPSTSKLLKATNTLMDNTEDIMNKENEQLEKQVQQFLEIMRDNLQDDAMDENDVEEYGYRPAPYQFDEEPELLNEEQSISELLGGYNGDTYDDEALYDPRALRDYPAPYNPLEEEEETDNFY